MDDALQRHCSAGYEAAKKLQRIYLPNYRMSSYSLALLRDCSLELEKSLVLFNPEDVFGEVKAVVTQRVPTNIQGRNLYDEDALERHFGWRESYYQATRGLAPPVATACRTPVWGKGGRSSYSIYIVNLVAPALDSTDQADYRILAEMRVQMRQRARAECLGDEGRCPLRAGDCVADDRQSSIEREAFNEALGGGDAHLQNVLVQMRAADRVKSASAKRVLQDDKLSPRPRQSHVHLPKAWRSTPLRLEVEDDHEVALQTLARAEGREEELAAPLLGPVLDLALIDTDGRATIHEPVGQCDNWTFFEAGR